MSATDDRRVVSIRTGDVDQLRQDLEDLRQRELSAHDTAVTMRLAGYSALVMLAAIAAFGISWAAAGFGLVGGLAVLVILLAAEVDQ